MSGVTIRRLKIAKEIQASQLLRFRVWSEQEGVALHDMESERIADDHDAQAYHWGAFNRGTLIASARLSTHHEVAAVPDAELFSRSAIALPTASMNRLVVDQAFRVKGIARELDARRISFSRRLRMSSMVVAPVKRKSRIESLLAMGFVLLDKEAVATWSKMPIVAMYLSF